MVETVAVSSRQPSARLAPCLRPVSSVLSTQAPDVQRFSVWVLWRPVCLQLLYGVL